MQASRILLASLLCAAASTSCGEKPAAPKLNVLFVTIDTLRADHLSSYGYFRETTPAIDALAQEGILFENCLSTMGTTLPSHLSLLTGLLPHQHGYSSNKKGATAPYVSLPGLETSTLFFKRAGYRTGGFVSGQTLKKNTGIDEGFDTWTQPSKEVFETWRDLERPAEESVGDFLTFLEQPSEEPFFAWLHLWDPHEPNEPQPGYENYFDSDEELEALVRQRQIDPKKLEATFDTQELARTFNPDKVKSQAHPEEPVIDPIDHHSILDLFNRYDAEIRYADDQLARVFAELKAKGLWESTIICVTGDHGQSNGQHDWLEHGRITLDNVHVPLVFRFPQSVSKKLPKRGTRIETLASGIDVMPTVLARLPRPDFAGFLTQAEGFDLLSGKFDRPFALSQRALHPEREHYEVWAEGERYGLSEESWRYYGSNDPKNPLEELYDASQDPLEQAEMSKEHPEVVARLRKRLAHALRRGLRVLPDEENLSPEQREHLERIRALGYAGEDDLPEEGPSDKPPK